jgi:uncharacterized protein (TIGR02646 family)
MRHITKGKEPESLTEYRATALATYDGYADKDALRQCLLRDQGHLCCYCMGRISAGKMRIDHWAPQHARPDLQLSYRNLLGACQGGERTKEERKEESAREREYEYRPPQAPQAKKPAHPYHHCDKHKGKTPLTVNPADPAKSCEQSIHYLVTGEITSDDPAIRKDLDETLNLNLDWLKRNRKAVADTALTYLQRKYPKSDWTAPILQREIQRRTTPDEHGMLAEYCQVAVYHLRKKLSRLK